MDNKKFFRLLSLLLVGLICFFTSGCRTAREKALETSKISNTLLKPHDLPADAQLPKGQKAQLLKWNATSDQSQHLLQLASEAVMETRYHPRHDLTLTVVEGEGVVEIEGERYKVGISDAVTIPRFHSYKILVQEDSPLFKAVAIYSPPYTGKDVKFPQD